MELTPLSGPDYPARLVAYTGTAGTTASWPAGPKGVWVYCTTDAYVEVGDGVTATTSSTPLPANWPVTIAVPSNGATFVVSAVQVTTGGNLLVRPMGGV
jgi:hypothetical protein